MPVLRKVLSYWPVFLGAVVGAVVTLAVGRVIEPGPAWDRYVPDMILGGGLVGCFLPAAARGARQLVSDSAMKPLLRWTIGWGVWCGLVSFTIRALGGPGENPTLILRLLVAGGGLECFVRGFLFGALASCLEYLRQAAYQAKNAAGLE